MKTGISGVFGSSSGRRIVSLGICAIVMESAYALIHTAGSAADQIAMVLFAYGVCGAAFGWLLWQGRRTDSPGDSMIVWCVVVGAAVLFRLTLLPLSPATSSDVFRYLWEGRVQAIGENPYVHAPDSEPLSSLAESCPEIHANVNHAQIASIYPPTAQFLFRANAVLLGGSLLGWKLILLAFDGLLAASGWLILRRRGASAFGLAALLWCPLLLLETYEGGHVDIIGVALMVLAVAAMERKRWVISAIAIGLAVNVKYLWPGLTLLLLIPCARKMRRTIPFVLLSAIVTTVVWWPYREGIDAAMQTVALFAGTWSFNDVLFELLRAVPGPLWGPMAVVTLALAGLTIALIGRQRSNSWQDIWLLCGAGLLLSPVAYPWYFLWIVPAVLDRPPPWWTVWILSVPALHIVGWRHLSTGQWSAMPWLWVTVTAVPLVLLILTWRKRFTVADDSAMETELEAGPGRDSGVVAGSFQ